MATKRSRVGVVLSGLLAAGKSTVEKLLVEQHGFRSAKTLVTRSVESGEPSAYIQVDEEEFARKAKRGEIVMPFRFGKVWYGYHRSTWKNIIRSRGMPWVFNVRPYTGLALATALPGMKAVWLDVPDEIRHRRVEARGADRDRERERREQDATDRIYRDLYPYVIPSHNKEECVRLILEIIE